MNELHMPISPTNSNRFFVCLFVMILVFSMACSDDSGQEVFPGDGDADSESADVENETETEAELLTVPFVPEQAENPYVDVPFRQEINHTGNEVEAGIGPLVAVLLPPSTATEYESPLQIAPRGQVTHDENDAPEILAIDETHPDLQYAAFRGNKLYTASASYLYGGDNPVAAPDGTNIAGLVQGTEFLYVLTDQGLGFVSDTGVVWPQDGTPVTTVLETESSLFVAYEDTLKAYPVPQNAELPEASFEFTAIADPLPGTIRAMVADVTLPTEIDLVLVGEKNLVGLDLGGSSPVVMDVAEFAEDRVPLKKPTCAAPASDGGFIVGTEGGAYRIMVRDIGPEWRIYNDLRWLPNRYVQGIATDANLEDGPIYFATEGGMASVTVEWMTLEEKVARAIERIVLRHDRDGAVADSRLSVAGDLSTNVPYDSDNDGGWTCYWLLGECFRYLMTGDEDAKAHFDKSLERMLSFQTLTGTDYFMARSVIRKDGCILDDCDNPDDGEWFTSPDGEWWVKADTSNDEVTSHMFMMGHAYDLCADETQQAAIRQHVDNIIGGIVDHGYQLCDVDGKVTSYGQFDPEYVNHPLVGAIADGGRRSVQMIANLTIAYYMTGKQEYLDAKQYLMDEHHYDENIVHECEPTFRRGSGDGDELATQAFFPLLRYESDPDLRAKWMEGWNNTYGNMKLQQAAMWDLINAVLGGEVTDFFYASRWLKLYPMDLIRWHQHNSHRLDLVDAPPYYSDRYQGERKMRSDGYIIPGDERPNIRHNTSQYQFEGGWGANRELDGADFIMPYWMGRYYGFIVPEK